MKVDRVKKHYSRRRDTTASKRNSNYEKLRNSPLCNLEEEEFKFIIKMLFEGESR